MPETPRSKSSALMSGTVQSRSLSGSAKRQASQPPDGAEERSFTWAASSSGLHCARSSLAEISPRMVAMAVRLPPRSNTPARGLSCSLVPRRGSVRLLRMFASRCDTFRRPQEAIEATDRYARPAPAPALGRVLPFARDPAESPEADSVPPDHPGQAHAPVGSRSVRRRGVDPGTADGRAPILLLLCPDRSRHRIPARLADLLESLQTKWARGSPRP
jgi:hypothetical protein